MNELTLLRNTHDDTREPSPEALAAGRAALLSRIAEDSATAPTAHYRNKRRWVPRLTWAAAGVATATAGILVAGNVTLNAQSAYASDVLRTAATQTIQYADLVAGSDQYLRSRTHARWVYCDETACQPYHEIVDVYMPADPSVEWVLYRDRDNLPGIMPESIETTRAVGGYFDGPVSSWVNVDYADIPLDGAAAYGWIDAQYAGGSASRDEDNFVRITDILRSGLVPAPQRAALLAALSLIPGVSATNDVTNLDGVTGTAIGRNEILRAGERQEIIIDPATGLVIGERSVSGTTIFGWGPNEEMSLTAIETTVVDTAP